MEQSKGRVKMHFRKTLSPYLLVVVLSGIIHAYAVPELPVNPLVSCNLPVVHQAFQDCVLSSAGGAPSRNCCRGLDFVFHSQSSPAAGCLCYPQVLYRVLEAAAQLSTVDVLGLLRQCAANHGMATEWALKPDNTCPSIPLNATATAVLLLLQPDRPLPVVSANISSRDEQRPTWAWSNLLQAGDAMATPELKADLIAQVLGLKCLKFVLAVFLVCPALFNGMHALLMAISAAYKGLQPGSRMVVCQHAMYALVFALQLVPQTTLSVRCFFKAWTPAYLLASEEIPILLGVLVMSRAALYLVEACSRGALRFNWLLVLHHTLFYVILFVAMWTENAAALVMGLVLDLFAAHEVLLFVVLLAYRLQWPRELAKSLLYSACSWYVATRLLQTAMLLYMIVHWASNPAVNRTVGFILTSVLVGAFTCIQAYTLVIYRDVGRKLARCRSCGSLECSKYAGQVSLDGGPSGPACGGCSSRRRRSLSWGGLAKSVSAGTPRGAAPKADGPVAVVKAEV